MIGSKDWRTVAAGAQYRHVQGCIGRACSPTSTVTSASKPLAAA